MVVGDAKSFPYRSSSYITKFFSRCGLSFVHDGSTRAWWAKERLTELNLGNGQSADLPSDDLCRVISELFDGDDFERHNERLQKVGDTNPDRSADLEHALAAFNKLVRREGLIAYLDDLRTLLSAEHWNGCQHGDLLAAVASSLPTGD